MMFVADSRTASKAKRLTNILIDGYGIPFLKLINSEIEQAENLDFLNFQMGDRQFHLVGWLGGQIHKRNKKYMTLRDDG